MKKIVLVLALLLLSGCTTGNVILSGCSDSDGKDFLRAGTTIFERESFEDNCRDSDIVMEFFCDGSKSAQTSISCSGKFGKDYVCKDGACVAE